MTKPEERESLASSEYDVLVGYITHNTPSQYKLIPKFQTTYQTRKISVQVLGL